MDASSSRAAKFLKRIEESSNGGDTNVTAKYNVRTDRNTVPSGQGAILVLPPRDKAIGIQLLASGDPVLRWNTPVGIELRPSGLTRQVCVGTCCGDDL
ncbi:hypothetical protein EBH_0030710 [Eimeria brunetti]|uniref:Uncharacterized protein n=1 Tax=Eimeria brunetti TaxID=51314 RepID=U6LIS4_9EIME|nr:hypothetical protein EBH_0030710 [Eimeria brunetti]